MWLDRRLFVAGGALAGLDLAASVTAARVTEASGPGDAVLADLTASLHAIAASYGSVPPAQTAVSAWSLERQVGVMSRWRIPPARRADWHALHARVLVLEGNALIDVGDTAYGTRALDEAERLSTMIGDWPTVAHTFAVRAMVARGEADLGRALHLARAGQRHAGRAPVSVMLAVAEASAAARTGDAAGTRRILRDAETVMNRLPETTHGKPGYSLDTYHPAQFALMAASALVLAKDVHTAEPFLDRARAAILPWPTTGPVADSVIPGSVPPPADAPASPAPSSRTGPGAAPAVSAHGTTGTTGTGRTGGCTDTGSNGTNGDTGGASGLIPLLRVVAADAALCRPRPDVDAARVELTAAVADGRDRPSAWLADEIASLAKVAADHGADLSDLTAAVAGWTPDRPGASPGSAV